MANLCNLNGTILDEQEAAVPVLDRGFLFGDSVYEVIVTRKGTPFAAAEHLERLRASADGLALHLDLDDRQIMTRIKATLAAAGNRENYIRIVATRGTGTAPSIELRHAPGPPNWAILVRDLQAPRGHPVKLAIVPRLRTDRRALDPAIKSGNYLNNVLGLAEALARGATECLFLNHAGNVTEASTSNYFLVVGDRLLTPPVSAGLLRGITRTLLLDCCAQNQVEVEERDVSEEEARNADEMFLSGTSKDIAPVTHLDGIEIHGGVPGPFTARLMERFSDYCDRRLETIDRPYFDSI